MGSIFSKIVGKSEVNELAPPNGPRALGCRIAYPPKDKPAPQPNNLTVEYIFVFVHGITGSQSETWTTRNRKGADILWPRDLLPLKNLNCRVILFGYDADVVNIWAEAGQNHLTDHINSLVGDLSQLRQESDTVNYPIIFVVHSMGGLLVQKALDISEGSDDPYLSSIYSSTFAIAFLGTPHRGSGLAFWGSLGTKFLTPVKKTNKALVTVLGERSETLDNIQRDFHALICNREKESFRTERKLPYTVKLCCFYEELCIKGVGKVVETYSASLDGWPRYAIHANHMGMSRFTDEDDPGFKRVHGQLWGWVDDLKQLRSRNGSEGGKPLELIICDDGHFIGGDQHAVSELLLVLLDLPVEQRLIRIRATPLEDAEYRRNNLSNYRRLKSSVELYEKALNYLIRGGVYYYWKWVEEHLIEAVIELCSLALPGIKEYESWYIWPSGTPDCILVVQFSPRDVDSVNTGYYGRSTSIRGMPQNEPIWLKEGFPSIVWERVAPAVALRAVREQFDLGQAISIDDWVLSDSNPNKLERSTPGTLLSGFEPQPWNW